MEIFERIFTDSELRNISKLLASMITGSQITYMFDKYKINDDNPNNTKWIRIFNSLAEIQNRTQNGRIVLNCISHVFQPTNFVNRLSEYRDFIDQVNVILAFRGLRIDEDGKFARCKSSETLSDAQKRASKLKNEILNRNLHNDLLKFCQEELLCENYFHAVLEATKSIASKIREKSGLTTDGSELIQQAFGGDTPILRINGFISETEKGEQRGFVNLSKGIFGTFRNPHAHEPKISWELNEQDAFDIFSMISYILRRIDNCLKVS